jgi:hypothetical protein
MRWIIGVIVAATMLPEMVQAQNVGFIMNRNIWSEMPSPQKRSYAIGTFDGLVVLFTTDSKEDNALKLGIRQCGSDLKFKDEDLVTLIDEGYREASRWTYSAPVVLLQQLHVACRSYVNTYRATAGLAPLPTK